MVSETDALIPKASQDGLHEDEKGAGHRARHCTDWVCAIMFFVSLCCMGFITHYATINGDFRRLYHGFNYYGELCGVDPAVSNKPFLYWCSKPGPIGTSTDVHTVSRQLDLDHPICVQRCPTGSQTSNACFQERTVSVGDKDPVTGTFTEEVTYTFELVEDYPTFTFAKGYCMPSDPVLYQQAIERLEGNPIYRALTKIPTLQDAYLALVAAVVIAFVAGYAYLFMLDRFAAALVYGCMVVATLSSGIPGAMLIYSAQHAEVATQPNAQKITTGSRDMDLGLGLALLGFSLLCFLVIWCCRRSIQLAIGCVESACECMFDMPGVLLEPAVNLSARVLLLCMLGTGLALLLSCGQVNRHDIADYIPGGVTRSIEYTSEQTKYIFFYLFMMLWIMEMCTATAQFVLAYCAQLWYFKEYVNGKKNISWNPLFRAYSVGLFYHLGTLAVGAFLVSLVRFARILLGFIARQLRSEDESGAHGITSCVLGCCSCCLTCFENFLRFVNKNAYMDVAINSSNFCEAASSAFSVITNEATAVSILAGACWIFQLGGVAAIMASGLYTTATVIHTVPLFADPASDHYVEDPHTVLAVAAVILFAVSVAFMTVFDVVSDTVLFSFALDRQRRLKTNSPPRDFAPPRLKRLLNEYKSD